MTKLSRPYLPRGMTRKPCPGCGKSPWSLSDTVCWECRDLLNEAAASRAEQKGRPATAVYRHHVPDSHWNPEHHIYSDGFYEEARKATDALRSAFTDLIAVTSEPALGRHHDTAGVLSPQTNASRGVYDTMGYDNAHAAQSRLMPVKVRKAIRAVYEATGKAIDLAKRSGYAEGSDLLGRLGSGDLSVVSFEESQERNAVDGEQDE